MRSRRFAITPLPATLADIDDPRPLPVIHVDEPTISITIGANTSPLAGKDGGGKLTARMIKARLDAEILGNVSIRVDPSDRPDTLLINAAWGLGEGISQGEIAGDLYWVRRSTGEVIASETGKTTHRIELAPQGMGTVEVPLTEEQKGRACLAPSEIARVAALARAVEDAITVPRRPNDRRRGAVDLPSPKIASGLRGVAHQGHRRVPGLADGRKRPGIRLGDLRARVPDPGDVGEHRARAVHLAPQVEQHELVATNHARVCRRRHVVRVAGVLRCRHHRRRVADEALGREPTSHERLDLEFGRRAVGPCPLGDRVECPVLDAVQLLGRGAVRLDGRWRPDGGKKLNQVARRYHLGPERTDELDRARVDPRDVGDGAVG